MEERITETPAMKVPMEHNVSKNRGYPTPHCPHILPIHGHQVICAPKINPHIGHVVFDPKNAHTKFLR